MRILATVLVFAVSLGALGQDQTECKKRLASQLSDTALLVGTGLSEAKIKLFFNVGPCKAEGHYDSPEIFAIFFGIEVDEKIVELQRQKVFAFKTFLPKQPLTGMMPAHH